jgi:hypothetical protein
MTNNFPTTWLEREREREKEKGEKCYKKLQCSVLSRPALGIMRPGAVQKNEAFYH